MTRCRSSGMRRLRYVRPAAGAKTPAVRPCARESLPEASRTGLDPQGCARKVGHGHEVGPAGRVMSPVPGDDADASHLPPGRTVVPVDGDGRVDELGQRGHALARVTHQAAVDFGLGDVGGGVVSGDLAAVEQRRVVRDPFPQLVSDDRADEAVPVCCLCRLALLRVPAGADRPGRLLGDQERPAGQVMGGEQDLQLRPHGRLNVAHAVFVERVADAQDRCQPVGERRAQLASDYVLGLAR